MKDSSTNFRALTIPASESPARTFLLGNQSGFVLYLPVGENVRDSTLLPIKWFGASAFGRKFLEANRVWSLIGGDRTALNRSNQRNFTQHLDRAERVYGVSDRTVHQTFFVPSHLSALVMTLEAEEDVEFEIEPQFDMRYYQTFNHDFGTYGATISSGDLATLTVSNRVILFTPTSMELQFYGVVLAFGQHPKLRLLREEERLRRKTYLKDEHREKLIEQAYPETHEQSPDEAPLWDTYETTVFAPARITGGSPLTLIYAFGDQLGEAERTADEVTSQLPKLRRASWRDAADRLHLGELETGNSDVDLAYGQVLTRFNSALVARDVSVRAEPNRNLDHFYAIFAGNKYFFDAWKRDENISLRALLVTGDLTSMRAILAETWRYQDKRTGRLPQLIRMGEPLVYYSSDGTLWALQRLHEYTVASGDTTLRDEKYPMIEHFFAASLKFVQRGLLPSGGIIDKAYLWETWEDTPYTPRDGYPVEIELLWLTNLAHYSPMITARNPVLGSSLTACLETGEKAFKLFYLDGYLADSLDYDWKPRTELTPNGYMAFELGYPLPDPIRLQMVNLARNELAGRRGIRGLAVRDWHRVLAPEFLADPKNVRNNDMASVGLYNYHRGIEWLWLNSFFVQAELSCGDTETAYERYLRGQVYSALHEGGVGGLGELYDARGPLGADFQAWSMAGFIVGCHAFAGVHIDALTRRIVVRPSIPSNWPSLRCRRQVNNQPLDLLYRNPSRDYHHIQLLSTAQPASDYTVRCGIRVPEGQRVRMVRLGGEIVDQQRWELLPACGQGAPGEVWIETTLNTKVQVEFELGAR
jgi:glycogen debranching enzyme